MKRICACCVLLALTFLLGGCFLEPAESLYAVPKQSENFYDLQSAVEKAIGDDVTYSPPTKGENQQAVQLTDLDGDGEDEAIVFWKSASDTPLTLTIFDKQDSRFVPIAQAVGAGNAFDRVQYAELDDRGGNEIIVGRQLGEGVAQSLNVYALRDGTLVDLLNTNYNEFMTVDLNGSGRLDLFLLHQDGDAQLGVAEYYHWKDDALAREREASMSVGVSAVKRMITGKMTEDTAAVFVASLNGEGNIVTDVFGFRDGEFTNLAPASEAAGVRPVRDHYVYCCDIDGDGVIELPRLVETQSFETEKSSQEQFLIYWYELLPNEGEISKLLTYHNYSGGWYLNLPWGWRESLAVMQTTVSDSIPTWKFYQVGEDATQELFSVAAVTGERAMLLLTQAGWQTLTQKGDTAYLALPKNGVTMNSVREMFRLIRVDWKTGETN